MNPILIQTVKFMRPLVFCNNQSLRFRGGFAEVFDEETGKVVDRCLFTTKSFDDQESGK